MADDPRDHIRQQPRFHLLYLAIALMGVFLLRDIWVATTQVEKIPYSEFQRLLAEGRRESDVVHLSAHTGEGIDRLIRVVERNLDSRSAEVQLRIPPEQGRLVAHVQALGGILEQEFEEDGTLRVRARMSPGALGRIEREGGRAVEIRVLEEPRTRRLDGGDEAETALI